MEEWIKVKDYAENHGITHQAVYQQMKRKKNKAFIDQHSKVIKGIKYLDRDAVEYLENQRENSPTVVIQNDDNERIKELEEENKFLNAKIKELYEENRTFLKERVEQSKLIAEVENQKNLVEQKEQELKKYRKSIFGLYKKVD